jgi:hypothetical protein
MIQGADESVGAQLLHCTDAKTGNHEWFPYRWIKGVRHA